jgi:hypothetical protein
MKKPFVSFAFYPLVLAVLIGCGKESNEKVATEDEIAAFVEENRENLSKPIDYEAETYVSPAEMERLGAQE